MISQNENIDFLEAVGKLVLIRKNIIKIAEEIIQNSRNSVQENKLIEEKISLLLLDMKTNNITINEEDLGLVEFGIKTLITTQIPLSKMAMKLRSLKMNPSR